jgi:ribosome biogenesis SPOUT family RNA methylase Rps3
MLAGLSGFLAFKFMVVGETEPSPDGRTAIVVTPQERDQIPQERDQILLEMRMFVETVQTIIVANNAGDMNSIALATREVGKAAQGQMSSVLVGKLPMGFKKLGFDTHSRFDQLGLDAEQQMSPEHISQQLGALMGNCVACHKTYRLATN